MGLLSNLMGFVNPAKSATPALDGLLDEVADVIGEDAVTAREHRQRLIPAIESALDYFHTQAKMIPGPIEVTAAAHSWDPFTRILFPSVDDVRIGLGRSLETREALPLLAGGGHAHVYALLGMRHRPTEHSPQPVFVDHTYKCLGASDADARRALAHAAFRRVLKSFREHIDKLRQKQKLLCVEWNIENDASANSHINDIKEFIYAENELSPAKMVRGLVAWLGRPSEHLRIERGDARIGTGDTATSCDLPVLHSADRRQWLVAIVRFTAEEGLQALDQETRSHRYIFV